MKDIFGGSNSLNGKVTEAKEYAGAIVNTVREPLLVLDKNLTVVSANENFHKTFGLNKIQTEGRSIYLLGDGQWDNPEFRHLLEEVLPQKGQVQDFEITHNSEIAGKRELLINVSQLKKESEEEKLILLTFKDREEFHRRGLHNILANAPAAMCTLRGPEHVFELVNDKFLQLVGQRDVVGKPVRKALPEVENQGFFEILNNVYTTGTPFVGNEISLKLDVGGNELKNSFVDFVYQPTFDPNGNVDGIFVHVVDVTEQVITRKKVEESEHHLRQLIDTVPAILWITDKEGQNIYLNENWYKYTGQTNKEAGGTGWLDVAHPDDRDELFKTFQNADANQEAFVFTYRLLIKNEEYRWVVDRGSPKFSLNGEYEGMIGTVVDVHEEKLKEQLIREKEHRIRSIVEEATVPTAVYTGSEMEIEFANDAMIKLWGKNRKVVGKTFRQALPELDGQPFYGLLQEVYSTGKTYWGKKDRADIFIDNKLQTRYFNFTYKALRNEKGEIYGILNMALDVTEMVESRILLKESESHFRQMADLMPDKVTNADAEGNFIYFNQNWLNYTGLSSEELISRAWTCFIHPDEKDEFHRNWKKSLTSGNDFEMELRISNKKGKYKWHLSRAKAVKDESGKIKLWIGTNTEIQKIKEEEKRKEDFLKMVSHELKTPITSIKGYVQLLLSMLKGRQEMDISGLPIEPSLERINHQIVRLTRLISEMLDLTRIEEDKLELQKENFCLNELVTETVQDINYTNTQHNIIISHDYKCKVYADKDRIGQVLINFITNAIKYSPDCQDVEVKIVEADMGRVAVTVKDKGIGIDKKDHNNIFKRFYRIGGKSEETYSGFGIGLFLAHEIIHRHNGDIKLNSEKGKGSEFIFTLSVASKQ